MHRVVHRFLAASTLFRVILAYCQCMSSVLRFSNVRWPDLFKYYIQILEYATIEVLALLPLECAVSRLGFGLELVTTLSLPVVSLVILLLVSGVIAPCAGRWSPADGVGALIRTMAGWAEVWDVLFLLLLLVYPPVARKTVSVFDCVPYDEGTSRIGDTALLWEYQRVRAENLLLTLVRDREFNCALMRPACMH